LGYRAHMWKMASLVTLLSLFLFSDSVSQAIATTVTPPPKPSLTPPRNPLRSAWSLAWCECGAANGTNLVVAVWPDGLDPSDGVNVTYNGGSPTWLTWGRVVQSVQWRCSGSTKTGTTSLSPPSRVWSVQVRCHARAHTHTCTQARAYCNDISHATHPSIPLFLHFALVGS
jgi:hypothetical protein